MRSEKQFIEALKREVIPALGCTEPISVALASAIAVSHLNAPVERIEVKVSPNLMKNGMGVNVPGTGRVGLHIAAAAGALAGNPQGGLETLRDLTEEQAERARRMTDEKRIDVAIAKTDRILYSEASVFAGPDQVCVRIADAHTNVIGIEKNGAVLFEAASTLSAAEQAYDPDTVSARDVYDFAGNVPFEDIRFILEASRLNDALSQAGLKATYGLHIGATLQRQIAQGFLADDLLTRILIRSAAASDARMGGAKLPAMSNSGSGNQGIAATMPVVVVADFLGSSEEERARALALAHMMAVHIHYKLPRLSALCAVTTASIGAAAGMGWLLSRGRYEPIAMAICSMIGDVSGMICDGASNSCAMKVSTSVGSAFKAVLMALEATRVTGNEGIVSHDVDQSIDNLCKLASGSMCQVDRQIIDIMTAKDRIAPSNQQTA